MSDTVKINGVIFSDVEYIKVPKYIEPTEEVPEPEPEYVYYRHTRNLTSPINIAEVFAGTATEINDFNGEINGVLSTRVVNNNGSLQTLILPAVTSTSGETCRYCGNLRYVKMDSCTSISYRSFRECGRLEEIDFPSLTSWGDESFYSCGSLKTVNVPVITYVGTAVFQNCSSLKEISLPECVEMWGAAFAGCSNLETLNAPKLYSIRNADVFSGCSKLLNYIFSAVTNLPNEYTFRGARFEEVSFPIYNSYVRYRNFRDASAVKSVRFPLGTGADSEAFYNCTSLKSVYIQKATWIGGASTFGNCSALEKLVLGHYFCTLGNTNVFSGSSVANGTGYVYVDLYFLEKIRNASNWLAYASQILPLEMLEDDTAIEYSLSLTLPANCNPKVHIKTSKCELDFCGNSKIIVGADSDTLQYSVECAGFVPVSGSAQISDADTNISIDLSNMQADSTFNGFSIMNLDFVELPVNRGNYGGISGVNSFGQYGYENYYDKGGISFSSRDYWLNNTITLPDYSGMTNPVFLLEFITDIDRVNNGGILYSMGGSNSGGGTLSFYYDGMYHYAGGNRMSVTGIDIEGRHHIAFAVTATAVYVYIDGELIGSYADTYLFNGMQYTTPRIGNNQSNTSEFFHGKLLRLCQTVRDIADPSVYENCEFMLDGQVPQDGE